MTIDRLIEYLEELREEGHKYIAAEIFTYEEFQEVARNSSQHIINSASNDPSLAKAIWDVALAEMFENSLQYMENHSFILEIAYDVINPNDSSRNQIKYIEEEYRENLIEDLMIQNPDLDKDEAQTMIALQDIKSVFIKK